MRETLKNCPFCGREPLDDDGCAMCMTDDCALDQVHIEAAAWNRRAEPAARGGDVDGLVPKVVEAALMTAWMDGFMASDYADMFHDEERAAEEYAAKAIRALRTRTPQDDVEGR